MDLSFIIVNYNTASLTIKCLQSIYAYTKKTSFEIILIDNASTTDNIKNIKELFPEIILIANETNVGFGKANNQGLQIAKGKYVFLLNSDTQLTSDAAAVFFNLMEANENKHIACCGADLINLNGKKQVSFGNFPSIKEAFFMLGFLVFFRQYFNNYISSGAFTHFKTLKEVDFICGADLFIRKSVLSTVGCFDPDFFLYFEEVELMHRIKNAGYSSVIIPDVKIIHLESASFYKKDLSLLKVKYMAESRRLYFIKINRKLTAAIVNKIYAVQSLLLFCKKWRRSYLKAFSILLRY